MNKFSGHIAIGIGFASGALFGVVFGALAAMLQNGPTLEQAIAESWWWFAAVGSMIAAGWLRAQGWKDKDEDGRLKPVPVRTRD